MPFFPVSGSLTPSSHQKLVRQRAPSTVLNDLEWQHCDDSNPNGLEFGLQHPGAMGGSGARLAGGGLGGGGGGLEAISGTGSHIADALTLLASTALARLPLFSKWHQR